MTSDTTDAPSTRAEGGRDPVPGSGPRSEPAADVPHAPGQPAPLWLPWLLAASVAAIRIAYAGNRRIVHLVPDEPGMLAMARFLSGGTRWNMFGTFTWQPGLAFLIAPANWLSDDPVVRYRVALLVVALIAGLSAVVLAAVTRRLTGLGAIPAACISFAVCVTPSSLSATSYVWAESLVSLGFLVVFWFVMDVLESATAQPLRAVAAVTAALGAYASHNRMLPLVVVVATLLVVVGLKRRQHAVVVVVVAALVLELAVLRLVASWIYGNVWDETLATNSAGTTIERLADPLSVLEALVGQLWYQLVATVGLAGVGMVVAVRAAARPGRDGLAARTLLLLLLPMLAVSATFVAGRLRGDFRIYGRYNDAVMWPVIALGIAWLMSAPAVRPLARRRHVVAAVPGVLIATGVFVELRHGEYLAENGVTRPMVSGLIAYSYEAFVIRIVPITVIAVVAFASLVLVASWPGRRTAGLVGLVGASLLMVGGIRSRDGLDVRLNAGLEVASVTDVERLLEPDESLGVLPGGDPERPGLSRRRAHYYQFFLTRHTLFDVDGPVEGDGIRFIFAPSTDSEMAAIGAINVWQDPAADVALWREPDGWEP